MRFSSKDRHPCLSVPGLTRKNAYSTVLLLALYLTACQSPSGPPDQVVRQIAQTLFDRAARGEDVPVSIPFTGQGPSAPRLLKTDISQRRPIAYQGSHFFEYEVRLTYLNRIQQMEHAVIRIRFERREDPATRSVVWQPSFPAPAPP